MVPRLTLVLQFIIFEINKGGNLSELSEGNYRGGPHCQSRIVFPCLSLGLEELNKTFFFLNGEWLSHLTLLLLPQDG